MLIGMWLVSGYWFRKCWTKSNFWLDEGAGWQVSGSLKVLKLSLMMAIHPWTAKARAELKRDAFQTIIGIGRSNSIIVVNYCICFHATGLYKTGFCLVRHSNIGATFMITILQHYKQIWLTVANNIKRSTRLSHSPTLDFYDWATACPHSCIHFHSSQPGRDCTSSLISKHYLCTHHPLSFASPPPRK